MTDQKLTSAQQRGLAILREHGPLSPRSFAELMWPKSPAWNQRTRGRDRHPGAMGGTMPMNGARLLWKLHGLGLARQTDNQYVTRQWVAR